MRRLLPILAAACAGITLLLLIALAILSAPVDIEITTSPPRDAAYAELEPVSFDGPAVESTPLDPALAAIEIAALRESRGTVLRGSSLDGGDTQAEFTAALATYTGEPARVLSSSSEPAPGPSLRQMAREIDEQAERLEATETARADELRALADEVRRVARSLTAKDEPPRLESNRNQPP